MFYFLHITKTGYIIFEITNLLMKIQSNYIYIYLLVTRLDQNRFGPDQFGPEPDRNRNQRSRPETGPVLPELVLVGVGLKTGRAGFWTETGILPKKN